MGTWGRAGTSWHIFSKLEGNGESMLAVACQDVGLVMRVDLIGDVGARSGNMGFIISYRQTEAQYFLGEGGTAKRMEVSLRMLRNAGGSLG